MSACSGDCGDAIQQLHDLAAVSLEGWMETHRSDAREDAVAEG